MSKKHVLQTLALLASFQSKMSKMISKDDEDEEKDDSQEDGEIKDALSWYVKTLLLLLSLIGLEDSRIQNKLMENRLIHNYIQYQKINISHIMKYIEMNGFKDLFLLYSKLSM